MIPVGPTSSFTSISKAADSITDSSDSNRYVLKVSPGIYYETQITLPSYVYVVGDHIDAIIVRPAANNQHVFNLNNCSGIVNITIENAGTGYAGVYCSDVGNFCLLHKVSIKNCNYGIYHTAASRDSFLFMEYVDFLDCNVAVEVKTTGTYLTSVTAENTYLEYSTTNATVTITLTYGGVTKDTVTCDGINGDIFPIFLQYTEVPGAATANLVINTTNGTFSNIRYIITKIN